MASDTIARDSDTDLLLTARHGDVALLTLNQPQRLNALTPALLQALGTALEAAIATGARAVVLTGAGRAFCSGADLVAGGGGGDLGESLATTYNPLVRRIANLPIPLITAVNGPAAGAGASLAMIGDIVIASREAYLLLAFVNIGLVPDAGATWLVAQSAGRLKALEMALLGERMSAGEALACGLVTRLVDPDDVLPTALALAERLAAMPTVAIGLIRRQVRQALDQGFDAALDVEAAHQSIAGRSEDFREGVAAFLTGRTPRFTGR